MIRDPVLVAACLVALAQSASAQAVSGTLTGTVSGADGSAAAGLPIQVRSADSATVARTFASDDGQFSFDLPAGDYALSIATPCCALKAHSSDGITVVAGQTLQYDVQLELGISLNALGDDPGTLAAEIRARQVIPDRPVRRTPDGRPDLSGLWLISNDPFPEQARALPLANEVFLDRVANNLRDSPHTQCLPGSPPVPSGATPFLGKFVQTPELVVILFEDVPGYRQVFLDGREHPEDPNPSWMGHSIGRWEDDTLVVDTVGFNAEGWTGFYPRTEMLHLTERYRRTEFGRLEVTVTFEDPGVFEAPWIRNMTWDLAPQEELIEYVCENNKWGTPLN